MGEQSLEVAVAGLVVKVDMHLDADQVALASINMNTGAILQRMEALADKFDTSIRRVHEKVETEHDKCMAAAADAKKHAQAAHDLIAKEKSTMLVRVIGWLVGLSGAGTVGAIISKKVGGP